MPSRRQHVSDRERTLDAFSIARKWVWISAERADHIGQDDASAKLGKMGDELAVIIEDVMKNPRRSRPPITRQLSTNGQRNPDAC